MPKPPRRTRERILETALAMFNQFGEPIVATTSSLRDGHQPGQSLLSLPLDGSDRRRPLRAVPEGNPEDAGRPRRAPAARRGLLALSAPRVRGDLEIPLLPRDQRPRRALS